MPNGKWDGTMRGRGEPWIVPRGDTGGALRCGRATPPDPPGTCSVRRVHLPAYLEQRARRIQLNFGAFSSPAELRRRKSQMPSHSLPSGVFRKFCIIQVWRTTHGARHTGH